MDVPCGCRRIIEKKLDRSCTSCIEKILEATSLEKISCTAIYFFFISKTIQVRRTRHAGHCLRSKKEISDVLLWTPSYGRISVGQPTRTFLQLCMDTECRGEDLPGAMDNRDDWWERIRASCATWSRLVTCYDGMILFWIENRFDYESKLLEESPPFGGFHLKK